MYHFYKTRVRQWRECFFVVAGGAFDLTSKKRDGAKSHHLCSYSLKENGVERVFTYGDLKFYSKVGFSLIDKATEKAALKLSYPEGCLGKSLLSEKIAKGVRSLLLPIEPFSFLLNKNH